MMRSLQALTRSLAAAAALAAAARAQDTTQVSVDDAGDPGNSSSGSEGVEIVVENAGTVLVFFSSYASDLVPNDLGGKKDLFLRDVTNGTTARVVMGLTCPRSLYHASSCTPRDE